MQFKFLGLVVACAVCLTLPVWAHHSHQNYAVSDFKVLEGKVTEVHLLNPHSWVYIEVMDGKGEPVLWALEATVLAGSEERHQREDLKPGDTVGAVPRAQGQPRVPARLSHPHAR
jgi:hypothetical protein